MKDKAKVLVDSISLEFNAESHMNKYTINKLVELWNDRKNKKLELGLIKMGSEQRLAVFSDRE